MPGTMVLRAAIAVNIMFMFYTTGLQSFDMETKYLVNGVEPNAGEVSVDRLMNKWITASTIATAIAMMAVLISARKSTTIMKASYASLFYHVYTLYVLWTNKETFTERGWDITGFYYYGGVMTAVLLYGLLNDDGKDAPGARGPSCPEIVYVSWITTFLAVAYGLFMILQPDGFLAAYNVEGDFPVAPDANTLRITTLFFGHSTLTRGLVQWSVIGDGSAMSIMNKVAMVVYPLWMGVNAAAMAYVGSLGLDTSPLKFNLGLYVVCMAIGMWAEVQGAKKFTKKEN